MSDSPAAHSATAWHADQRARITGYRPRRPQMPDEHRCAPGGCAEPPPPLPAGVEGFADNPSATILLIIAAAVGLGIAAVAVAVAARKRV